MQLVYRLDCFVEAAGKIAREEGKHEPGAAPEDGFCDSLSAPIAAEPVSHAHSSRWGGAYAQTLRRRPSAPLTASKPGGCSGRSSDVY